MIATGVFSHRPIDQAAPYDIREDHLHSLFSILVGFAFAIGVIAQTFLERAMRRRLACYAAVAASVLLPLGMYYFPAIEGVPQRLMFAVSFVWLYIFLPDYAVRRPAQ
jgi:ABC-type nitrate/sulfonate/bicarbonate transport system permease component